MVDHKSASSDSPKGFEKTSPDKTIEREVTLPRAEIPRPAVDIRVGASRSKNILSMVNDANQLTVGKNITLSGKIVACEKLIVEGHVEATLNDAQIIDVSKGGYFKGSADVTEASISGKFIGTLVAKDLLTVHKGGHVEGSIRYGRIIIEAGGEITGDMSSLEEKK